MNQKLWLVKNTLEKLSVIISRLQGVCEYIHRGCTDVALSMAKPDEEFNQVSYVILLPVPQSDGFSGKSELYSLWKASFNTLVGKYNIGFDEKMFHLEQYTSSECY